MDLKPVDDVLSNYPQVTGNLISILHEVQSHYNYLPEDALRHLSKKTGVPVTRLYSIATFYHFFSLTPKGKHQVRVCLGTACHVKGGQRILDEMKRKLGVEEGETTPDMKYTLDAVRCIGACSLAPVMVVDNDTHSNVTSKKALDILKKYDKA
ncbi:MAG TPA: NADH-quinone oxidoreductase subunit NuoE [Nitrospirota bacterium]|nr:NADH-quinone oxidoreductase subunit NuoE [Nitrospirota bacterium]